MVRAIRKQTPRALTLAIGDGSNDIAMIQASHVGIGVSGKEGLQAARVADFSIAQFRFLQRLLLVHGRWNYDRTAKFILWTFFKELFFYMMQALYQGYDGYTGSSLYESWSLTVLNTLFTSLCVIVPGILEQDLQPATLLAVPELYVYGQRNGGLNLLKYTRWMVLAAAEGVMVWFVVWAAWGHFNYSSDNGAFALGNLCFSVGIAWQNIKLLLLETHHQTWIVYASFTITFIGWWAWNLFLSGVYSSNLTPFDVKGGFTHGFGADANWWATFSLVLVALFVLELAFKQSKRYLRRMLMAGAWRNGDESTLWREDGSSWREKKERWLGSRVWSWSRRKMRKWMEAEWDVGVWQEIEAEGGMRERLLALAGES
jgi:phospholipid-translocating ATPase